MILLRKEAYQLTENIPAAIILSQLLYWHNYFLERGNNDPYIIATVSSLQKDTFDMFSDKTIRRALKLLTDRKLISIQRLNGIKNKIKILIEMEVDDMGVTKIRTLKSEKGVDNLSKGGGQNDQSEWSNCPERVVKMSNASGQIDHPIKENIKREYKKENLKREGESLRDSFSEIQKDIKKTHTQKANHRLSVNKMKKLFVITSSEYGYKVSESLSNKEVGLLKSLKKYLDEFDVPYKDYLAFCFENWKKIRKKIVWDNGKSKMGERPIIPDICYSKVEILSILLNSNKEEKSKKINDKVRIIN